MGIKSTVFQRQRNCTKILGRKTSKRRYFVDLGVNGGNIKCAHI
jgi:hypothetical protein